MPPFLHIYSHGRSILYRYLAVMGEGTRSSGAAGPAPATVQDAVFPPETSQADPRGSDHCRWLKAQRGLSWAREGVCVCLSSSLLSCVRNTLGLHIRLIWALFISGFVRVGPKGNFLYALGLLLHIENCPSSVSCVKYGEVKKKGKKSVKCITFMHYIWLTLSLKNVLLFFFFPFQSDFWVMMDLVHSTKLQSVVN